MNNPTYYRQQRTEILNIIDEKPRHVLDIGCGRGGVASTIKQHYKDVLITGFDKYKEDTFDYSKIFKGFYNFDLSDPWPNIDYSTFDLILLLDILEHLNKPEEILEKIRKLASKESKIIISLPNFHHYSNLYEIIRSGRFQYKESGILDKTHKHFYGLQDAIEMISKYFNIKTYMPFHLHTSMKGKLVDLVFGSKYSAYQNIFLCSPKKY